MRQHAFVAVGPQPRAGFGAALAYLLRRKATLHVFLGGGVCALWGWGLMWFAPTFLQRAYHLSVDQAGAVLGPIHLISGSLATLATAWILSL